ncbi:tRNA preQ1(34) S-adenosylmethionine ribosyltransferase-isomerase QueA [Ignatzschineria ureiclastica]|uniref:S-adenosylmethionine:tRNA ribosyltransferase-isomerase n=1 Tax=Ignatzschineria ureiclastica TaxID=472582 RepID=A0A2U2ACC1_9GAMM|nr:tRNA preQ1(34) S-adenosylmethionine ribosyltransferase-isomerase QueA [Ignatzschineria ureiclastica]PWD80304.1 tRNA preQ1(34) S-adenosylmethionine ribosyltransferase-isomerase QueA [Ignatzschineria ureiclastica]GHA02847.1 S-adenosylmethionine:tRNA ribosyltransferase-isomerase [Ignatzschineria ureiclastica]
MLKLSDYDYHLPEELIAQFPPKVRGTSRLLVPKAGEIYDHTFEDLIDYLEPGDRIVINNTRVLPARVFAEKETGGKVEIMVERLVSETEVLAQIKASKALKPGQKVIIDGKPLLEMVDRDEAFFLLKTINGSPIATILETYGHLPLPPYITRSDEELDQSRYQTVFNKEEGAVAAPTAGLHFTAEFLERIKAKGIDVTEITLHVGAGTFQPIRTEDLNEHQMHKEWINVPQSAVDDIVATKAAGKRVIAIGTTAVRALESAALTGELKPFVGDTNIFIKPGFEFRVIDGLLTNFHLPKSTLLVLVSTLMGKSRIEEIYQHAVNARYRFFSYGDSMLLIPSLDQK